MFRLRGEWEIQKGLEIPLKFAQEVAVWAALDRKARWGGWGGRGRLLAVSEPHDLECCGIAAGHVRYAQCRFGDGLTHPDAPSPELTE